MRSRERPPSRPGRSEDGAVILIGSLVVGLVGVGIVAFMAMMFLAMSAAAGAGSDKNSSTPSAKALADIPPGLLPIYQQAAKDT